MAIKLPELKKLKVIKPSGLFPALPPERLTKEWLTEYERVMGKPYVVTAEAELDIPPAIYPPTEAPVAGVTPPQGFVWDYETQQYMPATLDLDVTKKFYQKRPELLPEGVSPTLTPEDLDVLISEQEAKQEELVSTFKSVFPTVVEGMPEDDQIGIVSAFLTQLGENEAIQDWFVETVLDIGRTEQTESLLKELGFDEPKLKEFFAEPEVDLDVWKDEYLKPYGGKGLAGRLADTFMAGVGDVLNTSGGAARWLGFSGVGEKLSAMGTPLQMGAPPDTTGDFDWADLLDPNFYAEKVVRTVPFALALAPAAIAGFYGGAAAAGALGLGTLGSWIVGGLAGAALSRPLESALEAGSQYDDAIARGKSEKEAQDEAKSVFTDNMKLTGYDAFQIAIALAPTPKWVPLQLVKSGLARTARIGGKVVIVGLTEGGEEVYQDMVQRHARGEEWKLDPIAKEVFAIGMVMGAGMGLGGDVISSVVSKSQDKMPPVVRKDYSNILRDIRARGYGDTEAKLRALEALTGTPEGEQVVSEAVKETVDEVKPAEAIPVKPTVPEPIPAKPTAPEVTPVTPKVTRFEAEAKTATDAELRTQIAKSQSKLSVKGISESTRQWEENALRVSQAELNKRLAIPKAEVGMPEAVKPVATAIKEVTPKPEKAANIRLEKYPEELRDTIKEWADTHGAEVRKATRGIVSDEQVRAEAERLTSEVGGDLAKLRKKWKPATAWNAEELVAIRSVLRTKTQNVLNAQKAARGNNSTQNLLKLELALKEQAAIQEMVHGLTAEAGRALRSFRQETFDAIQSNDVSRMEELLKKIRGREDTEKIAEMLSRLDPSDSIAVNKFIQELYKPHAMDYLIELFYNSILSGPKTHIVNSLSNTANAIFSPVERFVSALVDMPLAKIQGRAQERYLSEVPADIFGAIRGIPEGFRQFAYVIKNGISFDQATKWEFRQKAFRGKLGAVVSMPSRFLEGADALMKAINQRAALNAEAHRIASKEKLSGQVFEGRVADLLSSPTEEMLKEANRIAEYRLFRQPPGKFGQTLMNLRDTVDVRGFRPLRFVMPFIRTPLNLVKYGLERTPLGFVNPKLWQNVAQKNPEAADQIARAMIGSIGLATLSWYFAAGMITGAPPRDRAERERFYREGKQPYAIRVGGFWVSYQRLEPFNQLLSMVAIVGDMIRNNDKGVDEKILDAVNTFGQNFVSQTYMSSVSDLMEMISEPERYAGKWLNRFASSILIPMSAATRTAAMMLDQTVRDPQNVIETIEASIPGLSKNVQSKISALGEDIKRKSPQWFPINITPVEETVLSQELERLKYNIGFVGDSISGIKLSDAEQREYQILAGQTVKSDLEKLMVAPEYWQATDSDKEKMLQRVVDTARSWAKSKMREKMWTTGATEDRMKVMETALKETDAQLGNVLSQANTITHEPPNIYDMAGELDASYRSLLANIAEESLNKIETPPTVASWYAKEEAKVTANKLTKKPLIEMDIEKDDITNVSRRQLELLREYNKLDKVGQKTFLEGLSKVDRKSLTANAYTDWLKANPEQNAQLAIWGEAKILTKEAYTEYNRLIRELDVVDSALPKQTLPPEQSAENYFKYNDIGEKLGYNSWEVQKMLVEDNDLREFLGREPIETPVEVLDLRIANKELNPDSQEYKDNDKRIEAISHNGKEYQDLWVERGNLVDKFSPGSSEAKAWLLDNPEIHKWALEQELLSDDGSGWNEPVIRVNVKWREKDAEYDALPTEGTARADYLAENEEYRLDRRRREAYQKGLTQWVENYVSYYELSVAGYRQERFLLNNPDFAKALRLAVPDRVPSEEYDNLLEKEDRTPEDDIRMAGYKLYIPDEQIENYVSYKTLPSGTYEDDWFLMEHPDFYKQVYLGILKNQRKDYRKVPTRKVGAKYLIYQDLPTARSRSDYRFDNPDLEDWLLLTGKVIKRVSEERRKAELTPAERLAEEVAERLRRIEELEVRR